MRFISISMATVAAFAIFASTARAGTITVVPSAQLRNSKGTFRCAIFTQSDGYPTEHRKAAMRVSAAITAEQSTCVFKDVPAGKVAVAVLHDENDNETMDNHETGMPLEGFGASNDAQPGLMSPPKFKDAVIVVTDQPQRLSLLMRYYQL
jgi:uncharacterized protein (DUF2141 family)